MPRTQRLKVYRTPIGFHDAYVAAPSQKAALAAWGADSNLFAQKIAEEVTEPELMKEPLAKPGEIIRKLRGTSEEQVKALGPGPAKRAKSQASAKAKPKLSRAALTQAEEKLRSIEDRHADELKAIEGEFEALKARLADLKSTQAAELKTAAKLRTDEQERYDLALAEWKKRAD
jgi:hypothetical protein